LSRQMEEQDEAAGSLGSIRFTKADRRGNADLAFNLDGKGLEGATESHLPVMEEAR